MPDMKGDLTRTVFAVLFLGMLIGLSLWILQPFLVAIVWATMIVVSTWPLMMSLQGRLRGKRSWAVLVMTLVLFLVLILPFLAAIGTLVSHAGEIADWAKSLTTLKLPSPPDWLGAVPLVGDEAVQGWEHLTTQDVEEWARKAAPYVGALVKWFVAQVGSVGVVFVESLMTVVIAAILYAKGERAAEQVLRFGHRLAGPRGEASMRLAAQAIRGVALGVVVTALVQAVLGGIGLAVAGVPFAAILTMIMFMFSVAQVGAVPVLIPAVVWLYWSGTPGWGTFLLIVTIVVGTLDNVLRPILITKGANLPLLLVFTGVVGGLIAFGLIGIFVGPVILAVAYTLFDSWVNETH
jgi:predicted PurR-regulated permease PerM